MIDCEILFNCPKCGGADLIRRIDQIKITQEVIPYRCYDGDNYIELGDQEDCYDDMIVLYYGCRTCDFIIKAGSLVLTNEDAVIKWLEDHQISNSN